MLHICGENLENAHDAMSDTVALRKIAEYGATSQGKNCLKFSKKYLAHVIEQPNFRIPNPQYFVYMLDQTIGRDILQFTYWNHATFSNSF